jgi:hypothetical protein
MRNLKKFLYTFYKVIFRYRAGFRYVYYKYFIARKITRWETPLEKKITHPNLSIHMLTCHRDAILAAWSLASYFYFSKAVGHVTLHDDGTLTQADKKMFKKLFPNTKIQNTNDFFLNHESTIARYPVLKKFRSEFPEFQSKKLIDVFFERRGNIILFLDSDLLWFQNPKELVKAVDNGARGVSYMMSNHPERIHVMYKDGTQTSDKVAECNSGVILFHEDNYDLDKVGEYLKKTDYMSRKSIFSDQACFATVLPNVHILPRNSYFIKGEITNDTIMRHYTGPSREKFYFYGVNLLHKKILENK